LIGSFFMDVPPARRVPRSHSSPSILAEGKGFLSIPGFLVGPRGAFM
jgi:hypothetical protein